MSHQAPLHTKHNEVDNFAILTGIYSSSFYQSTVQGRVEAIHKVLDPEDIFSGKPTLSERTHLPRLLMATQSNTILGDGLAEEDSSNFVHFKSSAGIMDVNYDEQSNFNISQKESDSSVSHGERPLQVEHNDIMKRVEPLTHIHAKRDTNEYSETLTSAELKPLEYSLRDTGFKPISIMPLPSSTLLSQAKRHPRSVDNNYDEDLMNSQEDGLISRALHFVDKLQWKSEACLSRRDKIIILKAAKFKPDQFFPVFAEEVNKTVHIANIINDLLLFTKSPPEDFMDIFFAMTQSLVETGPQVRGCAIAFSLLNTGPPSTATTPLEPTSPDSSPSTAKSQMPESLFPYSYRTRDEAVVVTDLSLLYRPQTTTWFSVHVNRSTEGLLKPKNRIYANRTDMGNTTSYIAKWNRTVSVTPQDGYWATPYYDCLLRRWIVQYSVPFYQLNGSTPEFK